MYHSHASEFVTQEFSQLIGAQAEKIVGLLKLANADTGVERWKLTLIRRRARRRCFHPDEIADAEQQIVLAMGTFRFDPERSNGATERTALTALVDHQLTTIWRAKHRREKHVRQVQAINDAGDCVRDACDGCDRERDIARSIDVREAIAGLSAVEQQICRELADGGSIDQIARSLGCSWHTVKRRIDQIRQRFQEAGLDGRIAE